MNFSRREQDILTCVARRDLDNRVRGQLRQLIDSNLDWDYLLSLANTHGLLPLLHKHLNSTAWDSVPGEVLARLKRESVANRQSVLFLIGKLLKACQLFEADGIEVAAFKGPLLAEMVYGEMSLRQAGDIDILIRPTDFARAKEILESLGYEMVPQLTTAQQSSHLASNCEIQFMRDDWFTVVDLHWGLTPKNFVFGLRSSDVMNRLQQVSFAGAQLKTFSPEDLLFYQSMHGAKHLWRRLEWISSIAELVRLMDAEAWNTLAERAVNAHGTRMLALGLRLVQILLDVHAPNQVLKKLDADEAMLRHAKSVAENIFRPQLIDPDSTDTNLKNFRIMDRKRDAIASAFRSIFVPTLSDWEALSIPGPLHSLYYAYRPFRLTKAYSASLLQRLKKRRDG